jgi:hypothetical protein
VNVDQVSFSCPSDCNGNGYAIFAQPIAEGSTTYNFGVIIDTSGYTGGSPGWLAAVAWKNFATTYSDFTTLQTYTSESGDGMSWAMAAFDWGPPLVNELNANGCGGGDSGGVCFESGGFQFTPGQFIQLVATAVIPVGFNETSHLKYLFIDEAGKKVGGLGSFDIPVQLVPPDDFAPPPPGEVPEPATLAMMGAGLGLLGALSRLRKKN